MGGQATDQSSEAPEEALERCDEHHCAMDHRRTSRRPEQQHLNIREGYTKVPETLGTSR